MMTEVWLQHYVVAEQKLVWELWASFHDKNDAKTYTEALKKRFPSWKIEVRDGSNKNNASK